MKDAAFKSQSQCVYERDSLEAHPESSQTLTVVDLDVRPDVRGGQVHR